MYVIPLDIVSQITEVSVYFFQIFSSVLFRYFLLVCFQVHLLFYLSFPIYVKPVPLIKKNYCIFSIVPFSSLSFSVVLFYMCIHYEHILLYIIEELYNLCILILTSVSSQIWCQLVAFSLDYASPFLTSLHI